MKTEQPILISSITAGADLSASKNLLIDFDGTVLGADQKQLGVLNANTNSGEEAPVTVKGIAMVYSGAAITLGNELKSNASGKVITWATSGKVVGYALDAATGADELIRVALL